MVRTALNMRADYGEVMGLVDVIRRLAAAPSLPKTMEIVTQAVRTLLRADGATFVLKDGDLCHYADEDAVSPLWKGLRFPLTACISGWCMMNDQAVAIPDIYEDSRIPFDAYRPTFVRSLAMAPVRQKLPFAAVGAYWSKVREITDDELALLQTIADASGLAISVAQLEPLAEARREAEAARAREEARAQEFFALADNIPTLCSMAYADGEVYWRNRRWAEYTGLSTDELAERGSEAAHDPDVLPDVIERWELSLKTGQPFEMTFPLRRHDGKFRQFLTRVAPIRNPDGRISRWFGSSTDVTDQLAHEEHLRLLVNELNHRVKNTLATVQSLAAQTLRGATDPEDAAKRLEGRILGLSAAHNILTERNWEGAPLHEVVERTVRPFIAYGQDRFRAVGPEVWLKPQAAVALSLALHELATNALKYGALSTPSGDIALDWDLGSDGELLTIRWTEAGGPPVFEPAQRGFGSRLVERSLPRELGAPTTMRFEPAGLVCTIGATAQAFAATPVR